jgi:putative membrane protein
MNPALIAYSAIWIGALIFSAIGTRDIGTWWMETAPASLGIAILIATRKSFPFTPLLYGLMLLHALILMLGGHYTYAEVPLGYWMKDWFGFTRNHYDRIGHFAQGFVPAMIARELLLRKKVVARGFWLPLLIILSCLGISALYELGEWLAAILLGAGADNFLGTQGDPWDTQSDMFFAGLGATTALITLSRAHDAQLKSGTWGRPWPTRS